MNQGSCKHLWYPIEGRRQSDWNCYAFNHSATGFLRLPAFHQTTSRCRIPLRLSIPLTA